MMPQLGGAADPHGPRDLRQHGRRRRARASSPTVSSRRCAIRRWWRWLRTTAIRSTCWRAGRTDRAAKAGRLRACAVLGPRDIAALFMRGAITPAECVDAVEGSFREQGQGDVGVLPRAILTADGAAATPRSRALKLSASYMRESRVCRRIALHDALPTRRRRHVDHAFRRRHGPHARRAVRQGAVAVEDGCDGSGGHASSRARRRAGRRADRHRTLCLRAVAVHRGRARAARSPLLQPQRGSARGVRAGRAGARAWRRPRRGPIGRGGGGRRRHRDHHHHVGDADPAWRLARCRRARQCDGPARTDHARTRRRRRRAGPRVRRRARAGLRRKRRAAHPTCRLASSPPSMCGASWARWWPGASPDA